VIDPRIHQIHFFRSQEYIIYQNYKTVSSVTRNKKRNNKIPSFFFLALPFSLPFPLPLFIHFLESLLLSFYYFVIFFKELDTRILPSFKLILDSEYFSARKRKHLTYTIARNGIRTSDSNIQSVQGLHYITTSSKGSAGKKKKRK
jgi:hypothetical protein